MDSKMFSSPGQKILRDMLSIPTAPFAEHLVVEYVERFCAKHESLKLTCDSVGNMLIHLRQGRRKIARPVCVTAHLDHPGFVAHRMLSAKRLQAFWRGGVPKEYFVGSRVRFWVDKTWVRGRVRSIKTVVSRGQRRAETASVEVPREIPAGSIGMWDLPEPKVRNGRVYARSCDDMAGAAAILSCINKLVRARHSCDAYFLLTRAEEVGFAGAIAATRLRTIPQRCFVVAMDTSSELPHARMGAGPILRVGDKTSAFTHATTAHCHHVAGLLAKKNRSFKHQRKLMDGGTCEASAYGALGFEATGVCLALGNYHNVDKKRKRIAPEYIDLNDFDNVVAWFVALARAEHPYTGRDENLLTLIREVELKNKRLLRTSRRQPR
ncbi:MAG: M20/M25/M40 family metallo-hydrolase [Phycisphaerales bacterium]|nr:MAG: M20/M25/M40 family metallo-hydrolase [Phycisphaerales bacterium]